MPRPPEDVRRRIEELIAQSKTMGTPTAGPPPGPDGVRLDVLRQDLWRFLISSLQTVGSACGPTSPHLREFERVRASFIEPKSSLDLDVCRGVLEAARDDLAAGMLADLRQLVTAEAFGDLLESAQYLLDEGHLIPAVAVAGAVLESSLRTLAKSRAVTLPSPSSINKLNAALYTAKVYDKVVMSEIEAWGKLRNQVDHGEFAHPKDVDAGSVTRMVSGVRDFALRFR